MTEKINKTKTEWQKELSPEEFRIMRERGTEQPFTGEYWDNHDEGVYRCACCGSDLFSSAAKYDSGSGWPSFFEPLSEEGIRSQDDHSHGMQRVEVLCSRCDAHLGHLFEDGPEPTGLRYCVNSAALKFDKSDS